MTPVMVPGRDDAHFRGGEAADETAAQSHEDSSMRTTLSCLLAVLAMLSSTASRADAQAAFARMRSLVGEWRAPLPGNETMIDIFRPIAFGTALLHEEWKNGEQLTATVFYVVGSELRADHYCDMGNQLRYVDESKDPQTLRFVLRDASNLDTHPHHFHSTTWRRIPENDSSGTKALETNVSGMITMKDALLTTSTLGTIRPTNAMTQLIA